MSDKMEYLPEPDDRQLQDELAEMAALMAEDEAYQYWLDQRENERSRLQEQDLWEWADEQKG